MMRNIYHLAVKEFLHIIRDRRTLAFLLLMPSALTVLFGYAIQTSKVSNIKTRVIDLDHGRIAEEYIKDIRTADTFALTVIDNADPSAIAQAEADLQHDVIKAFVVLPADLTSNIMEGRKAEMRAVVDASDTFSAPAILRELHGVAIRHNLKLAAGYLLYEGIVKTK